MKDKDQSMTLTPDFGQTFDTFGGVKHAFKNFNAKVHLNRYKMEHPLTYSLTKISYSNRSNSRCNLKNM